MQLYQFDRTPKYIMEYAEFACGILGLDRLRGDINIFMRPTLEGSMYGYCAGDGDEADIYIAQKRFGEKVPRKYHYLTVGHELTHARQFLKRELAEEETDDGFTMWKGRKIKYDPTDETNCPWEVEAVEYEKKIWKEWKQKYLYK